MFGLFFSLNPSKSDNENIKMNYFCPLQSYSMFI